MLMFNPFNLQISFNGIIHQVLVEEPSVEMFKVLCFSLSEVEPEKQLFLGLPDPFAFSSCSDLRELNLKDNQLLVLCPTTSNVDTLLTHTVSKPKLLQFPSGCINTPMNLAKSAPQSAFIGQILSLLSQRFSFENPNIAPVILNQIPLTEWFHNLSSNHPALAQQFSSDPIHNITVIHSNSAAIEQFFVKALNWFHKTFKFVKTLSCDNCGKGTQPKGTVDPSMTESLQGVSRVELFECSSCGHVTRFLRHNSVVQIFEYKKGRCGEFAQAFTAFMRVLKFEARLVFDFADHLWVEIFAQNFRQGNWTHVDPCENTFDKPLLYTNGWKKKLAVVLGFDYDRVVDVTRRYVTDEEVVRERRTSMLDLGEMTEDWIYTVLHVLKLYQQKTLRLADSFVEQRDVFLKFEEDFLERLVKQRRTVSIEEQKGRISGSS
ncbi:hypothetical protein RCL1_000455 [Eukaryota sp. TZLM3-RCL]